MDKIVPLANAGIEVRSSAFLVEEYAHFMEQRKAELTERVLQLKANLLGNLSQKAGWIETYHVPHYYFQVFFDIIYGISFHKILELISSPELEGNKYFIVDEDSKTRTKGLQN